jgi:hypothetical protein
MQTYWGKWLQAFIDGVFKGFLAVSIGENYFLLRKILFGLLANRLHT